MPKITSWLASGAWIAFYVCAPHHVQYLCHRALLVACSGFLTVADIKCDVGATRESNLRS
jgi:hypothetical protein